MERTDFKNVIFEKIPWAPFEVAKVAEVKLKTMKILNETTLKIDEI